MSSARVAVMLPYWDFWEASAGEDFRQERADVLAQVVETLAAMRVEVAWRGTVDSATAGEAAVADIRASNANVRVPRAAAPLREAG